MIHGRLHQAVACDHDTAFQGRMLTVLVPVAYSATAVTTGERPCDIEAGSSVAIFLPFCANVRHKFGRMYHEYALEINNFDTRRKRRLCRMTQKVDQLTA